MKKIIIGADHAGFDLKEAIRTYLAGESWEVSDVGTDGDAPVDYPDLGCAVALRVSTGEFGKGILICGSGVGMAILANKFPGVRAVMCLDEETARLSRMHNDTNILSLAGRRTNAQEALPIVRRWLATDFKGGRHQRRIDKIGEWERKICQGKIDDFVRSRHPGENRGTVSL